MGSSGELAELLVSLTTRGVRHVTVDVSGLSFVDAAAVRALVMAANILRAQAARFGCWARSGRSRSC